jgi:hypothetical protein
MLGLRSRPSSRALKDATDLLKAVGTDEGKLKILEEIAQALAKLEAVIEQSRDEKKSADKAKAEAENTIAKARVLKDEAEQMNELMLQDRYKEHQKHQAKEAELNASKQDLSNSWKDFREHENRTHAFFNEKQKVLDQAERTKRQADALMAEAQALKDSYKSKLARIKAIADE